ncbi:MAG: aldo/keto reductase [Betaproteobacteria bacterium]
MISTRPYGKTGIAVSAVGLGAGQIGHARLSENAAHSLLDYAIDHGVTLIDTAPSYGFSEARIGRCLGARRKALVLSTKLGYGVEGIDDWTGACITAGVDQALRILQTEYLDIAHLHSCSRNKLERGEVIDALEQAKQQGKIRAIAYSGENEDLDYAVSCNRFDGFMASLNICDQRVIDTVLRNIHGKGFIAKRPSANHPWRFAEAPIGNYCETYWYRWHSMNPPCHGLEWGEIAIRFALSVDHVSSAVVGTGSLEHLQQNLDWAANGELANSYFEELRARFRDRDQQWIGQI